MQRGTTMRTEPYAHATWHAHTNRQLGGIFNPYWNNVHSHSETHHTLAQWKAERYAYMQNYIQRCRDSNVRKGRQAEEIRGTHTEINGHKERSADTLLKAQACEEYVHECGESMQSRTTAEIECTHTSIREIRTRAVSWNQGEEKWQIYRNMCRHRYKQKYGERHETCRGIKEVDTERQPG
jgi:hypothetical protein